jgi:hypothetical protein
MQAVFTVGPLQGYMSQLTMFCWVSECSAVVGNGRGIISIDKIRYQETSSEDTVEE